MQRLPDTITILAARPTPRVGDKVRVTRSTYTRACPVGTIGWIERFGRDEFDPDGFYTIRRLDGGYGWCQGVEPCD